jgi:hypothetical protein
MFGSFLRRFLRHSGVLASLQSRFDGRPGHQSNIGERDLIFLGGEERRRKTPVRFLISFFFFS